MIHHPLRLPVEQRTGWMDVHHLVIRHSAVAFLWIFSGGVTEETARDGFLRPGCRLATRHHVKLVSKNAIDMIRPTPLELILVIV